MDKGHTVILMVLIMMMMVLTVVNGGMNGLSHLFNIMVEIHAPDVLMKIQENALHQQVLYTYTLSLPLSALRVCACTVHGMSMLVITFTVR